MININNNATKMELLAPAGDWEALLAAVAAGADAVYLGGKAFSARQYAANFDLQELKQAVDLLHLHRKKIYVTVNTLIADAEMPEALQFLAELYNLGVDAVIIQDLGLIKLAHQYLPQLELHASTQMTVHNSAGVLFLKKLGLRRVVLTRELTAAEVGSISKRTGVEVEVFVHGALCVCYSGQCLMSSMIGGRSGNRGRCAQPCRLEYQLYRENEPVKTKGAFLLSPKDLALAGLIPELNRAGVSALKIEGRMKRPEYVYTVVKTYRRLLDRFYRDPETYKVDPLEIRELSETFNRGFSTGYFGGNRNQEIIGLTRPNNRGIFLGRIIKADHQSGLITVKLEAELALGDLIEVWVSKGGRAAGAINTLRNESGKELLRGSPGETVTFAVEGKAYPGDRVFKVATARIQAETKTALDPDNPALKIGCRIRATGRLNSKLKLDYQDELGNQTTVQSTIPLQKAINRPLTTEVLREQLGRLGNTPFRLIEIDNRLEEGLMLPLSELNELRRQATEALFQAGLRPYFREKATLNPNLAEPKEKAHPFRDIDQQLSIWVGDLPGVFAAAKAGADLIYAGGDELSGFKWDRDALERGYEAAHSYGAAFIIGLPRINREGQEPAWTSYLKMALETKADGIILSDLGSLELALNESDKPLYLNYPLNFFNQWSIETLSGKRIKQITLSPELSLNQVIQITRAFTPGEPGLECLVQGPLELMVSEYCPIGSILGKQNESCHGYCKKGRFYLKDRLNMDFPVYTDQYCRMHLLNSVDLCLFPDLERLTKLPVTLRLELKTFGAEAITFFVENYKRQMTGHGAVDSERIIEKFRAITGRGITKGHYFRGVE